MGAGVPLKVLFVSRAYPPVVGGIERQNFEIAQALGRIAHIDIIANHRGKRFLPLFMCYALFRLVRDARQYDVVLLGDGVLAVLGFIVKKLLSKPVVCVLHGLDVTFHHPVYQYFWLKHFLPAIDKYIAVGNETIRQGVLRGLLQDRFVFIGNGVDVSADSIRHSRDELEAIAGRPLPGPVLLTLGRLVKRKGVEWFIRQVMPQLPNNMTYLVAGDGRERLAVQQAICDAKLQDRVIFLGAVTEQQKQVLLHTADLFVQPNIPVPADMEGFGLVVLEAAAAGRVVVASRLEGLKDAIHDGRNGLLVEPGDAAVYVATIIGLLQDTAILDERGKSAAIYVAGHFSWPAVAQAYLQVLRQVSGAA